MSEMNRYAGTADRYISKLIQLLSVQDRAEIDAAIGLIAQTWQSGHQIIAFGNGGSAMTALHMMTDWSKSISHATGKPFRGRTLLDNMGLITAYANDVSYADVFVEQLKTIILPGDLVIAISGSGNSENIIRAVNYANQCGAASLGLCGFDGGKLKAICKYNVWANVDDMQLSEDIHAIFNHIVMQSLTEMI